MAIECSSNVCAIQSSVIFQVRFSSNCQTVMTEVESKEKRDHRIRKFMVMPTLPPHVATLRIQSVLILVLWIALKHVSECNMWNQTCISEKFSFTFENVLGIKNQGCRTGSCYNRTFLSSTKNVFIVYFHRKSSNTLIWRTYFWNKGSSLKE